MAVAERLVLGVDASATMFVNSLRAIKDQQIKKAIVATLRTLLFADLDALPAKLHLHQLSGREVVSATQSGKKVKVWTLHVTPDDRYKASFTLEDNIAYLRLVDEHDVIDKRP